MSSPKRAFSPSKKQVPITPIKQPLTSPKISASVSQAFLSHGKSQEISGKDGSNSASGDKTEGKDAMFSDLTDEELLELFTVVDADGGGTIDRDELKEVMMKLKVASSEAEMERIINQIDEDGNGEIDPEEFIEGFRRSGRCKYSSEEVLHALSVVSRTDSDPSLRGTGTVSVDCIIEFLQKYAPDPPSDEELKDLMKALPIDNRTKTFTYEHFVATMIN
eukprot:MONOS_13584.1-p1 / transcript=MONOS_13584.1 / gene=MONOS_13584 / organism=Monocercomonoides_exilis_PA203 / gene_product=Calmodulin / transcript_product=Calmodulin / location=Mono_scaffold00849:20847-21606(-) / protein_length=220 / sequence_SO=supercontig / SO=protein_coding / is_pseudo=false